jgi:hypothetical protein
MIQLAEMVGCADQPKPSPAFSSCRPATVDQDGAPDVADIDQLYSTMPRPVWTGGRGAHPCGQNTRPKLLICSIENQSAFDHDPSSPFGPRNPALATRCVTQSLSRRNCGDTIFLLPRRSGARDRHNRRFRSRDKSGPARGAPLPVHDEDIYRARGAWISAGQW